MLDGILEKNVPDVKEDKQRNKLDNKSKSASIIEEQWMFFSRSDNLKCHATFKCEVNQPINIFLSDGLPTGGEAQSTDHEGITKPSEQHTQH